MAGEEVRFLEGRDLDAEVARAVFGLEPVCVAEEPWEECHIDRESLLNFSCNFGGAVFTDNREWVSRRLEEGTTRPAVIVRAYGWLQGTAAVAGPIGGRGPRDSTSRAPAETAATPAPSRRKPGPSLGSANRRAERVRTRTAHPLAGGGPVAAPAYV